MHFKSLITLFLLFFTSHYAVLYLSENTRSSKLLLSSVLALLCIIPFFLLLRRIRSSFLKKKKNQSEEISTGIKWIDEDLNGAYHDIYKDIETIENKKMHRELNALQSQINPHFLYNTIDSIRGKALMNKQFEIADLLEALSTFFRYHISSKGDFVSVREELENIDAYMEIQRFRFHEKIILKKELNGIDTDMYYLPKLVIQPLVENAIYHGIEQIEGNGLLQISFIETKNKIKIEIEDNGKGIPREDLEKLNKDIRKERSGDANKSFALKNINSRIKKYFGNVFGLVLYSIEGEGTKVVLTIPKLLFSHLKEI